MKWLNDQQEINVKNTPAQWIWDNDTWNVMADQTRQALQNMFWQEEAGLYGDSQWNGDFTGVFSELANGLALKCDIATDAQVPVIADAFEADETDMVKTSPLAIGHVIEGLLRRGRGKTAMKLLERFRFMIEAMDNPTIWENRGPYNKGRNIGGSHGGKQGERPQPHPARSLVHGAGAKVAKVLTEYVLGVQPVAPGFRECVIAPVPSGLAWVNGTVPTPRGDIHVSWQMQNEHLEIESILPEG